MFVDNTHGDGMFSTVHTIFATSISTITKELSQDIDVNYYKQSM